MDNNETLQVTEPNSDAEVKYVNQAYRVSSSIDSGLAPVLTDPPEYAPTEFIDIVAKTKLENEERPEVGESVSESSDLSSSYPHISRQWIRVQKCDEESENKSKMSQVTPEVYLLGFTEKTEILFWGLVAQPSKPPLSNLMRTMMEENLHANVVVHIGEHYFECHLIALKAYSQYFRDCKIETPDIILPTDKITACGFHMLYNWILADFPIIQREGIMELLQAATFLEVAELQAQCWKFFDDFNLIKEHYAYFMYAEGRKYDLHAVIDMMLQRITKFFLPLVASQDFLEMPLVDVTAFLSSNYIGVNTEAEVFMAALLWLDYKWESRQVYQVELMRCIRFSLLPPYFLISLNKPSQHSCPQIERCFESKEISEMVDEALRMSIWQMYDTIPLNKMMKTKVPVFKRLLVFDKSCKYHDKRVFPNMNTVTYASFMEYLSFLQTADPFHYETFELIYPGPNKEADFKLNKNQCIPAPDVIDCK